MIEHWKKRPIWTAFCFTVMLNVVIYLACIITGRDTGAAAHVLAYDAGIFALAWLFDAHREHGND